MIPILPWRCLFIPLLLLLLTSVILPSAAVCSGPAAQAYDQGLTLTGAKDYAGAGAAFDNAIASDPSCTEAWNAKADALNRNGQFAQALQASDRALAIDPSFVRGWINRGYILYNLGKYDDELLAYEKAIALDPGSAEGWFNRGYALAAQGKYDDAIRSFDRVREIEPAYPNLEANRRLAEKNRNAATPPYLLYFPWIAAVGLILLLAIGWYFGTRRWKRRTRR